MKHYLLALIVILGGCEKPDIHKGPAVIVYKNPLNYNGTWQCQYEYMGLNQDGNKTFYDSCTKYNIGDTIKPKP